MKIYVNIGVEEDIAAVLKKKQSEEQLPNMTEVLRVLLGEMEVKKKHGK